MTKKATLKSLERRVTRAISRGEQPLLQYVCDYYGQILENIRCTDYFKKLVMYWLIENDVEYSHLANEID